MNIVVILGTARKESESAKVANYLQSRLREYSNIEYDYLDLSAQLFPIMTDRFVSKQNVPEILPWMERIKSAQGLILIVPEYKNGYPGALKNFLDYLPAGIFRYKSIGIVTVSSGQGGGSNCLAQLRLVAISMGGIVIPDRMQVPHVKEVFGDTDPSKSAEIDRITSKFLDEFQKYCRLLSAETHS